MFGEAGQHAWTNFIVIVKGKYVIGPTHTFQDFV